MVISTEVTLLRSVTFHVVSLFTQ